MRIFKKRIISICAMLLTLALVFTMLPVFALAAEEDTASEKTNAVTVYLSISHDAGFLEMPYGEIMAFKKMTVPYFDLALYGLQRYYFVSESYERGEGTEEDEDGQIQKPSSNLEPGSAATAAGKVTMLHALIYATEVYYCGVEPEDAGKGYLKTQKLIGTDVFKPEGSVGSMYLRNIWDMDENLNYYHNYKYPLASEGWGSTADQILLHDGDIVTVGHFSNWSFHQDPLSVFNLIKAGEETVVTEVAQNQSIDLTVYLAGKGGNYTTAHTPRTEQLPVYYTSLKELDTGVVTQWNLLGTADTSGNLTVEAWMAPGEYLVCVAGQYGKDLKNAIVSAPGGIILKVTESVLQGDVNGDGTVNIMDLFNQRKYLANADFAVNQSNADLNSDGAVNILDLFALRKKLAAS